MGRKRRQKQAHKPNPPTHTNTHEETDENVVVNLVSCIRERDFSEFWFSLIAWNMVQALHGMSIRKFFGSHMVLNAWREIHFQIYSSLNSISPK